MHALPPTPPPLLHPHRSRLIRVLSSSSVLCFILCLFVLSVRSAVVDRVFGLGVEGHSPRKIKMGLNSTPTEDAHPNDATTLPCEAELKHPPRLWPEPKLNSRNDCSSPPYTDHTI